MMGYKSSCSENDLGAIFEEIGALPRPKWSFTGKNANSEAKVTFHADEPIEDCNEYITPMPEDPPLEVSLNLKFFELKAESSKTSLFEPAIGSTCNFQLGQEKCFQGSNRIEVLDQKFEPQSDSINMIQSKPNYCVNYRILNNGQLKIGLKTYKNCPCTNPEVSPKLYHGPWVIYIDKRLIDMMKKVEAEWRKKLRLKGPSAFWPPEKKYEVKTFPSNTCLRVGVKKKEVSEVLEYIMDTNTEKFNYEPPPTVRLTWFMEEQLKRTELVNDAYDWDTDKVLEWITARVGFPQYQECFEVNGIRGRHLVLLDAEALENMGVKDFDHIQKITSEIRKMFKIRRERNVWRDVVEARYDPLTLHAMYNFKRVSRREPVFDFYVKNHFIDRKVPHFSLSELKKPIWNIFPRHIRTVHSTVVHKGKRKRLIRVKW